MTKYFRVGNRSLTEHEMKFMTAEKLEQIKKDGELANQKRLENMRKGLGLEPQKVTLDVTPTGIAARNAAIKAEEDRIAAETKAVTEEIGPATSAVIAEGEAPVEQVKKSGNKKAKAA